jgi:hypothetical protein
VGGKKQTFSAQQELIFPQKKVSKKNKNSNKKMKKYFFKKTKFSFKGWGCFFAKNNIFLKKKKGL